MARVDERILVAEDEAAVSSMLRMVLEAHGFEVEVAASAAAARKALAADRFDIVITDMRMESSTAGYEVARAAAVQSNRPAVLILTGFPLLASEWKKTGAHALLQKPVEMTRLLACIRQLLQQRHGSPAT